MPSFHFRLEGDASARKQWVLDLPDVPSALRTGKHVAREMAAKQVRAGHLRLAQDLLIESDAGEVLGRLTLGDAVLVS